MSLDVTLSGEPRQIECRCCDCGHKHTKEHRDEFFSRNVTHNLNVMATEAGLYEYLWRPEEKGITKAEQLLGPLACGLGLLESDPERFRKFNPSNGWGSHEGLVEFVREYLAACRAHPNANVEACR